MLEGVHQGDDVGADRALLSGPGSAAGQETGRPVSAQVGHDDTVTGRHQRGDDLDVAVDVVGVSVQQQHDFAIAGPGFEVPDLQRIGDGEAHRFEPGHHYRRCAPCFVGPFRAVAGVAGEPRRCSLHRCHNRGRVITFLVGGDQDEDRKALCFGQFGVGGAVHEERSKVIGTSLISLSSSRWVTSGSWGLARRAGRCGQAGVESAGSNVASGWPISTM